MATNSTLPPIPPDIIDITAPQLIGTLFNWMLYGILSVQTYVYYLNFPDDTLFNKGLVYGTYIIEIAQTAMTAADLYYWFASGYGNMIHLGHVYISPADTPILCGIIAVIVQCFFAYRIFMLRRSYLWICILIVLTALLQTAGAFGTAIRGFKLAEYSRFHEQILFPESFHVWLISDTVCDILIAGTMLWIFYQTRKEGMTHGTKILAKLVRLIVETNSLTAGMALLSFIAYVALPNNNLFICTTLIMGKLYSNTLLVTFNNRLALRKVSMNEHSSYGSGGTGRTPVRRPGDTFASEVSTFRIATDRFATTTAKSELETYEIDTLKDPRRDSTTVGSTA
ncbi:hypothetical protein LshimejAT787_2300550 [Lyophyllum shimeji]|uniref:DUF6534 domain-containing protein n=1 Tax=Lyophyllum shimeji TaxID=47721 RepID=A0A9P3PYR4_LYOSH|nr:hypothetical protein LshimejAT787_2300550 [Lyophyllum shimeji]